jgi:heme/copper-type cytochrome/quinol oxidase subunit 3
VSAPAIAIRAGTLGDAREPGRLGMLFVIATEASFFAYLLFAYFYLASMSRGPWPPAGAPSLSLALPNTLLLIASSGTMWIAESGIRAGDQRRLRLGLLATLILGAAFLSIQAIEYSEQVFTPQTNAYGSLFYTITGFHGAHVLAGLLMNVVAQVQAWRKQYTAARHLTVSNVAAYWHFVDAVWIVVFTSLYLVPRLR